MKYRKLGNSGFDVSVVAHGTWGMGNDFFGDVDENNAVKALRTSIDSGVNLIDTAAAYGEDGASEKLVGKALKGLRDKVIVATKLGVLRFHGQNYVRCCDTNVMRIELEQSLKNLQTDYIDLYQIHWPDYNNSMEAALEELVKMKKEGKIRAIGVSNFNPKEIKMAKDIADISSVQPPMSLLDRSAIESGVVQCCIENDIGILTYGSLGGGILSGSTKKYAVSGKELRSVFYGYYDEPMWSKCQKLVEVLRGIGESRGVSVAQVSINWVLAQKGVTCALMGTSRPEQAAINASAADWELTQEELKLIDTKYSEIIGL